MMNSQFVPPTIDSYSQYTVFANWKLTPIPLGSKAPIHDGWNLPFLDFPIPNNSNAGLMHVESKTCAIDIDNLMLADALFTQRGISIHELLDAPDAVQIVSGRDGSRKLIYSMPTPLQTKRIKVGNTTAFEFRCGTSENVSVQDVLPPSMHPSGTQYTWAGKGQWYALPEIPLSLLAWWTELLKPQAEEVLPDWLKPPSVAPVCDFPELIEALNAISSDCDYHTWIDCGMALKTTEHFAAFYEWSTWSNRSPKPATLRTMESHWKSFRGNGVTIGTIYHHARQAGWKKQVDVSSMFNAVEEPKPTTFGIPQDISEVIQLGKQIPRCNPEWFPKSLSTYAMQTAQRVGANAIIPLFAGLIAGCAAADSRSRLIIDDGFEVPPVLWAMTIASPSAKKTPSSKPMFTPLDSIESDSYTGYKRDHVKWQAMDAMHQASLKEYTKQAGSAEFLINQMDISTLPFVPDKPIEPVPMRLTITDATSQKVVRMAAERPYGMACILDEGAAWLKKLTNPMSGEDRSSWVVAYEASRYTMDRVGDGTTIAENFAISVFMNAQPNVLKELMVSMSTDGLAQRFMPVLVPDSECSTVGVSIPEFLSEKPQYERALREINTAGVKNYHLAPEGLATFKAFEHYLENLKVEERLICSSDGFQSAIGKLTGLAGRLSLMFHLFENPHEQIVSDSVMTRVIEMIKQYMIPAMDYMHGLADEKENFDSWVANHVVTHPRENLSINVSDVRRSARAQLGNLPVHQGNEMVIAAMTHLETLHWVMLDVDTGKNIYYHINPLIFEQFASRRAAVVKIKQARLEANAAIAKASGKTVTQQYARGYEGERET